MKKLIRSAAALSLCVFLLAGLFACSSKKTADNADSGNQAPAGQEQEDGGSGDAAPGTGEEEDSLEASAGAQDPELFDLTGNWAQKDADGTENYVAGYINDRSIEIFWMSDEGKTGSLYWSGSYIPPTEADTTYTWDSVNDKSRTEHAVIADREETKTFTYGNGELSFKVSMMGQTNIVTLVRSGTDYSVFAPETDSSGDVQDGQQIQLGLGVYSWVKDDRYCRLYYAARLQNPNAEYAIRSPKIQITPVAENGAILATQEDILPAVAAGDTVMYANQMLYEGDSPANVEMTASNGDDAYLFQEDAGIPRQSDIEVTNVSETGSETEKNYTGEVTNNSGQDLNSVCITVIFKNGENVIGGLSGFMDGLQSGETKPFEIRDINGAALLEYDSYEIYAMQWH